MIKVGGRPGISTEVKLTQVEIELNNTNKRWGNDDGTVNVASANEVTNALLDAELQAVSEPGTVLVPANDGYGYYEYTK